MTEIDPQMMRDTLRLWASGVSVVTTARGAERSGMTVSAFASLSLEPPQILVCLAKDARTAQLLRDTGVFAVSFLNERQAGLSDRFAGRVPLDTIEERFNGVEVFSAVTGAPILADSIAWLDCRVLTQHDGSSHWIVIGEVLATGQHLPARPLLYFDRDYRSVAAGQAPS
jgi:flavin reductase (DIM6/NTAB) family NADH-FMN oxidoreductase RutF